MVRSIEGPSLVKDDCYGRNHFRHHVERQAETGRNRCNRLSNCRSSKCPALKCRNSKFRPPSANSPKRASPRPKRTTRRSRPPRKQATDVFEDTYSTASKGCASYGLKLIETTRANSDAAFDLMSELMTAKSYSEVVELSSAYLRKQFDAFVAQAKELSEHAQKVATETAEPIKESISSTFNKAA